jgi:hypothetical protein
MEILKKEFKEHSHRSIEDIKRQQYKHCKEIIQPRADGQVNPEYVKNFGAKSLNISERDVSNMYRKDSSLAKILDEKRRNQNN